MCLRCLGTLLASELGSEEEAVYAMKVALAKPNRYYGSGGTIHSGRHLDVECHNGRVVAVWFRCTPVEFEQHNVEETRAADMDTMMRGGGAKINGIEISTREGDDGG